MSYSRYDKFGRSELYYNVSGKNNLQDKILMKSIVGYAINLHNLKKILTTKTEQKRGIQNKVKIIEKTLEISKRKKNSK